MEIICRLLLVYLRVTAVNLSHTAMVWRQVAFCQLTQAITM